MRKYAMLLHNESGSVMNVAMLVLLLLALVGVAVSRSTTTDVKITGNYKVQTQAFYAAEAARAYVISHPELYDASNITPDANGVENGKSVPSFDINSKSSFDAYVAYLAATPPPRGSGVDPDTYRAHTYRLDSNGAGPQNAKCQIQVGFYRIGF